MLFAQAMESGFNHTAVSVYGPIGCLAVIFGSAVAIVAVLQWRRIRIAEMEATLKQQMLDRGMTADEITRVLSASMSSNPQQLGS